MKRRIVGIALYFSIFATPILLMAMSIFILHKPGLTGSLSGETKPSKEILTDLRKELLLRDAEIADLTDHKNRLTGLLVGKKIKFEKRGSYYQD